MVQCDVCKKWLHFECVGVDDSIKDMPWKCYECGGEAYPASSGQSGLPVMTQPTQQVPKVEDVLTLIEEQQAREQQLRTEMNRQRIEHERLALEYNAVKRLVDPHTEEQSRRVGLNDDNKSVISERYQAVVVKAAELRKSDSASPKASSRHSSLSSRESLPVGSANQDQVLAETFATSVGNSFGQLATLMKQAQVEELPKFSGSYKDWPLFLAVFKRTTSVASIDDTTNVGRLTKALEGEARELVLDQLTFGLNPNDIIETLKERYGRKDELLKSLSLDLISFPVLSGQKDPNFQKFAILLKTYVAQLKALELNQDLKNNLQEAMLRDKLVNVPSMHARWRTSSRSPSL